MVGTKTIMIALSRAEVNKFFRLLDTHRYEDYEEAISYGQTLLRKDPLDGAGIRYGIMSACAVLGKSRIALNTAKKVVEPLISEGTKAKWLKIPPQCRENRKTAWLLEVDPPMLYPLAMSYWKEEKPRKAKEIISIMIGWIEGQGGQMLHQFMDLTEGISKEEYAKLKKQAEAEYSPISVDALIACVDVPFEEIKAFNDWLGVALFE